MLALLLHLTRRLCLQIILAINTGVIMMSGVLSNISLYIFYLSSLIFVPWSRLLWLRPFFFRDSCSLSRGHGFSKVSGWFPRPKRIQYFHQFNLLLHLTWGWQSWKLRFILCSSYCVSVDFPGNGPAAALSSVPAGGCVMRYGQMSRRERLVYYSSITTHIHF